MLNTLITQEAATRVAAGTAGGLDQRALIGTMAGTVQTWVNLLAFLLQAFVVSRLFKYIGVRGALFILPFIALGGYTAVALLPMFAVMRWTKVLENGTDYSVNNTTRHALFLPTSRAAKYKAKQAIDSFFVRAGDLLQAVVVFVGVQSGVERQRLRPDQPGARGRLAGDRRCHRARTQKTGPGRSRQRCGLSGDSVQSLATLAMLAAGLAGICAGAGIPRGGAPAAARGQGGVAYALQAWRPRSGVDDRRRQSDRHVGTRGPVSRRSEASSPAAASRSAPAFATAPSSGITARSIVWAAGSLKKVLGDRNARDLSPARQWLPLR